MTQQIRPSDIEDKLRNIQGEVESVTTDSKKILQIAAVAGAVLIVGVVYVLGRRAGKRNSTVVEIRRL